MMSGSRTGWFDPGDWEDSIVEMAIGIALIVISAIEIAFIVRTVQANLRA
jgi:hypothetical protein